MNLDDTRTDLKRALLIDPQAPWLPEAEHHEPDLEVDGLLGSAFSRLLGVLLGRNPR